MADSGQSNLGGGAPLSCSASSSSTSSRYTLDSSHKQDAGSGRLRSSHSSSGGRQKLGRSSKPFNNGHHPQQYGGRRSNGNKSKTTSSEKVKSEEEMVEVGSVYKPGRKKINGNHLLNFDYGPERGYGSESFHGEGKFMKKSACSKKRNQHSVLPKYTKEHYLQANCKFLVKKEGDYEAYFIDPDLPVEWDSIEQVTLKTNDHPSCPICLYQPRAAKMTRCGHVYCWPCILHYLALSDDACRKCPICEEEVSKEDLKSVITIPLPEKSSGMEIEMYLMRRKKSSMFAFPVTKYSDEIDGKYPGVDQEYNSYSRLILANANQVISHVIKREKHELLECYEFDKDEPEVCFILEAINALEERSVKLMNKAEVSSLVPQIDKLSLFDKVTRSYDPSITSFSESSKEESPTYDSNRSESISADQKDFFHFYQAVDGQMIFLHGLNANMLKSQFGDLKDAPINLSGKILEIEAVTITPDIRDKFRYLRHLPLLCNVLFVELDLSSVTFNEDVIIEFREKLEERKIKRHRKAKFERKREKQIMIEEKKLMGKYPDARYRIESNYHFPEIEDAPPRNDPGEPTFAKITRMKNTKSSRSAQDDDAFPSLGAAYEPPQRSNAPSWPRNGGEALRHSFVEHDEGYVPEKPSGKFDLGEGVLVLQKKGKKKGKKQVRVFSAVRPML